jgi:hypothetical protein
MTDFVATRTHDFLPQLNRLAELSVAEPAEPAPGSEVPAGATDRHLALIWADPSSHTSLNHNNVLRILNSLRKAVPTLPLHGLRPEAFMRAVAELASRTDDCPALSARYATKDEAQTLVKDMCLVIELLEPAVLTSFVRQAIRDADEAAEDAPPSRFASLFEAAEALAANLRGQRPATDRSALYCAAAGLLFAQMLGPAVVAEASAAKGAVVGEEHKFSGKGSDVVLDEAVPSAIDTPSSAPWTVVVVWGKIVQEIDKKARGAPDDVFEEDAAPDWRKPYAPLDAGDETEPSELVEQMCQGIEAALKLKKAPVLTRNSTLSERVAVFIFPDAQLKGGLGFDRELLEAARKALGRGTKGVENARSPDGPFFQLLLHGLFAGLRAVPSFASVHAAVEEHVPAYARTDPAKLFKGIKKSVAGEKLTPVEDARARRSANNVHRLYCALNGDEASDAEDSDEDEAEEIPVDEGETSETVEVMFLRVQELLGGSLTPAAEEALREEATLAWRLEAPGFESSYEEAKKALKDNPASTTWPTPADQAQLREALAAITSLNKDKRVRELLVTHGRARVLANAERRTREHNEKIWVTVSWLSVRHCLAAHAVAQMERELVDFEHECAAVVATRRKQIVILRQKRDVAAQEDANDDAPASPLPPPPPKAVSSRPKRRFASPPTNGSRRAVSRSARKGKQSTHAAQASPDTSKPQVQDQVDRSKSDRRPATPAKPQAGADVGHSVPDVSPGEPFVSKRDHRRRMSSLEFGYHPCDCFDEYELGVRLLADTTLCERNARAARVKQDRGVETVADGCCLPWSTLGGAVIRAPPDGYCGYAAVSRVSSGGIQLDDGRAYRRRLHSALRAEPERFALCFTPERQAGGVHHALQRTCPDHPEPGTNYFWYDNAILSPIVAELESAPLLVCFLGDMRHLGAESSPRPDELIRGTLYLPVTACATLAPRAILASSAHFDAFDLLLDISQLGRPTILWTQVASAMGSEAWQKSRNRVDLPPGLALLDDAAGGREDDGERRASTKQSTAADTRRADMVLEADDLLTDDESMESDAESPSLPDDQASADRNASEHEKSGAHEMVRVSLDKHCGAAHLSYSQGSSLGLTDMNAADGSPEKVRPQAKAARACRRRLTRLQKMLIVRLRRARVSGSDYESSGTAGDTSHDSNQSKRSDVTAASGDDGLRSVSCVCCDQVHR